MTTPADSQIYLDYNASTPLAPSVAAKMREVMEDASFGNPSSLHWAGAPARAGVGLAPARLPAPGREVRQSRSTLISAPASTRARTVGSPSIAPRTLTGLAGRISLPRLIGVGPQKRQSAPPGGQ